MVTATSTALHAVVQIRITMRHQRLRRSSHR